MGAVYSMDGVSSAGVPHGVVWQHHLIPSLSETPPKSTLAAGTQQPRLQDNTELTEAMRIASGLAVAVVYWGTVPVVTAKWSYSTSCICNCYLPKAIATTAVAQQL